jgi:Tol biopolymer transport system component
MRRLALVLLPCVAWLASACHGAPEAAKRTTAGVQGAQANGPIWFLGGRRPGSVFGRSSGAYRVVLGGGRLVRVRLPNPLYSVTGLAASPDGRWIALSSGGGEPPPRNIYVMRSDGSGARRITSGDFNDVSPAWSPGGDEIVFSRFSTSHYALYVVRPDGTGLRRVIDDGANDTSAAWSPAGDRIAYVRIPTGAGLPHVWVVSPDGTRARGLTGDARFYADVAWSPDGRRLATISYLIDERDWQVRVMEADGSGARTVAKCMRPCRRGGYSLEWSPDGTRLAFTVFTKIDTDTAPRVAIVDVSGGDLRLADTHGVGACCLSWIRAN